MQTGSMKRLLRINPKSPSGYTIVGYLEIQCEMEEGHKRMAKFTLREGYLKTVCHDNIMISDNRDWINNKDGKFDSYELGVKRPDGTRWYEGDVIEYTYPMNKEGKRVNGVLTWDAINYVFSVDSTGDYVNRVMLMDFYDERMKTKRIGNIHQEAKDE